jgi:hypothetical protein
MFVVVKSKEDKRTLHTDHKIKVRQWNENTQSWETIWEMVRSEPFTAQVEVEDTMQYPDTVNVTDPKSPDSQHEHAFTGILLDVKKDCVKVEDQDGDVYDVSYDEIQNFEVDE